MTESLEEVQAARKTFDQVVAENVRRLRDDEEWSMAELAERLGKKPHDVLAFEGQRNDRSQRPFRWTELVELAYVFRVPLFDLVLPDDAETEIYPEGTALMRLPLGEVAAGWPRRDDLGYRLFGIGGDLLWSKHARDTLANKVREAAEAREALLRDASDALREAAEKLTEKYPGLTIAQIVDRMRVEGG